MVYYASMQDGKDFSKLTYDEFGYAGDDAFQELILKVLEIAEGTIDTQCKVPRGFFKTGGMAFTEYADYTTPFTISQYKPIVTLTSLSYDTTGYGTAPSWSALTEHTDFIYYNDGRFYIFSKYPGKRERSIKIVYTAGYSTVPEEIRLATLEFTSSILHTMLQRKISPTVEISDMSIRIPTSIPIPPSVLALIGIYRRH